jgi:Fe2+ transport system protein FeoA
MKNHTTLSEINVGQTAIIQNVRASELKVKLMERGLIKGKTLQLLYRAPFGDPLAFDVEGYVLSLRLDEAMLIDVEIQTKQGL